MMELLGTAAFAVTGAMLAAEKRMDLFGVCIMGLVSACGGGVLRDVLLGRLPPMMFCRPVYTITALCVSALVFLPPVLKLLSSKNRLYEQIMLWADAVGLGVFTAVGVVAALDMGYGSNPFFAVFLGVLTGVGGGVIRDTLASTAPYIFVKHVYACASVVGAILCVWLIGPLGETASMMICCVSVIAIRFLAARFHWSLPKADF